MLIAEFPDAFHKFFCCRVNTALTLYCFKQDRTGLIRDQIFHTIKIVVICKFYTRHQRFKRLLIMFISGDGQCPDASSMERMIHGNDLMSCVSISRISVFFSCLDCTFDCFRTTVGKKYTVHSTCFFHTLCRMDDRYIIIKVRCVHDLVDLCF